MTEIEKILRDKAHRPYEIPKGNWVYYQEWNRPIFLHWSVPYELLKEHVPTNLPIDTFEGNCYITMIAFTLEKVRPRFLPSIGLITDFEQINLRTYIDFDNKKGVYFLNIEAGKLLGGYLAKTISGLPYEKAKITRTDHLCFSENKKKGFRLLADFEIEEGIEKKTELDLWLTERYCLYLNRGQASYRYDIQHQAWDLKKVHIKRLDVNYNIGEIDLKKRNPNLIHYSEGVKVLAWKGKKL